MKKLITIVMALALLSSAAICQSKTTQMTAEKWAKDLDYLGKKIDKEFNSFDPSVKGKFRTELATLKSKVNDLENHEVACEIMRLLSLLRDGHTELNIGHRKVGFHRVPLSLYIFEGRFYVLAAHKDHAELVGGTVTHIGAQPIDQAFERLKQNMSHDNDMEFLHAGPGYIILTELLSCLGLSEDPNTAVFTIQKTDGTSTKQIFKGLDQPTYSKGPWATYAGQNNLPKRLSDKNRDKSYWYEYLEEEQTLYFHFRRVNNQKGQPSIGRFNRSLFEEIDRLKPEKLVIDLRQNNGGNYHLTKPIVQAITARDWLNQKGKVWVMTGRLTFSAASTMAIFMKQETNAILIGEPGRTHPNWADNNEYMSLPNSDYLIEYTTKVKVHWPERPDVDRVPVDVVMPPTFEAYKSGRDAALEHILNYK